MSAALPARIGDTVEVTGPRGTLRVTKTKRDDYHLSTRDGARWGNGQATRAEMAAFLA